MKGFVKLDNKIVVAIIIAVGLVAGIYIYSRSSPFNQCVDTWVSEGLSKVEAIDFCASKLTP